MKLGTPNEPRGAQRNPQRTPNEILGSQGGPQSPKKCSKGGQEAPRERQDGPKRGMRGLTWSPRQSKSPKVASRRTTNEKIMFQHPKRYLLIQFVFFQSQKHTVEANVGPFRGDYLCTTLAKVIRRTLGALGGCMARRIRRKTLTFLFWGLRILFGFTFCSRFPCGIFWFSCGVCCFPCGYYVFSCRFLAGLLRPNSFRKRRPV